MLREHKGVFKWTRVQMNTKEVTQKGETSNTQRAQRCVQVNTCSNQMNTKEATQKRETSNA